MLLYSLEAAAAASAGALSQPQDLADFVDLRGRAWPHHCDYLGHINNAQYFKLMDYGRIRYFSTHGFLTLMLRGPYSALVAGSAITYLKAIDLMQRYTLRTRVCFHTDAWLFFEQLFCDKDGVPAVRGVVRVRLLRDGRAASFDELCAALSLSPPALSRPADIAHFDDFTREAIQRMKS